MKCKRIVAWLLTAVLVVGLCAGCADKNKTDTDKLQVICSIFPSYDFVRQVAGDIADVTLLLSPGQETHSYEPTPKDILAIQNCDLFVCVGGESETWVTDMVNTVGENGPVLLSILDCVDLLETAHNHEDSHDHEDAHDEEDPYDEHVWTAPRNAIKIVQTISEALVSLSPDHAATIKAATVSYQAQLTALDAQIREIVDTAATRTLVFGDRFPFRYFADSFGLTCLAPYETCAHDAEPSAAAIAALINSVKAENLPVVLYIEFSNQKIADTLCEATGAQKRLFHSCHNVTAEELQGGATYLSLMNNNVAVLKEALG